MHTTHSRTEKLNLLAAGLLTALGVHALLCLATLPAIFGATPDGFLAGVLKVVRILWNVAGIGGAGYLIFRGIGMINGSHYANARLAAMGAILLPFLGSPGAVTAFALIPIGLVTSYLLRHSDWIALFRGGLPIVESVQPEPVHPEAEAFQKRTKRHPLSA